MLKPNDYPKHNQQPQTTNYKPVTQKTEPTLNLKPQTLNLIINLPSIEQILVQRILILLYHPSNIKFLNHQQPAVFSHSASFFRGKINHFFHFIRKIERVVYITQISAGIVHHYFLTSSVH